jgi:hypothetical protein
LSRKALGRYPRRIHEVGGSFTEQQSPDRVACII